MSRKCEPPQCVHLKIHFSDWIDQPLNIPYLDTYWIRLYLSIFFHFYINQNLCIKSCWVKHELYTLFGYILDSIVFEHFISFLYQSKSLYKELLGETWITKWTHCVPQCHIRPTRSANNNACHYIAMSTKIHFSQFSPTSKQLRSGSHINFSSTKIYPFH